MKLKNQNKKIQLDSNILVSSEVGLGQGSSTGAIRGDLNNLKNWGAISQLQILL